VTRNYLGCLPTADNRKPTWWTWTAPASSPVVISILRDYSTRGIGIGLGDPGSYIRGLAFSFDGKILAAGHRDNVITIWDPSLHSKIGDSASPVGGSLVYALRTACRSLTTA